MPQFDEFCEINSIGTEKFFKKISKNKAEFLLLRTHFFKRKRLLRNDSCSVKSQFILNLMVQLFKPGLDRISFLSQEGVKRHLIAFPLKYFFWLVYGYGYLINFINEWRLKQNTTYFYLPMPDNDIETGIIIWISWLEFQKMMEILR